MIVLLDKCPVPNKSSYANVYRALNAQRIRTHFDTCLKKKTGRNVQHTFLVLFLAHLLSEAKSKRKLRKWPQLEISEKYTRYYDKGNKSTTVEDIWLVPSLAIYRIALHPIEDSTNVKVQTIKKQRNKETDRNETVHRI